MKPNLKHQDLFEKIAEHFHGDANVQRAYGEPIHFEGRTIIPVANVTYSYGFGEGGGWGEKDSPEDEAAAELENTAGGNGYGFGGSTKTTPLGVLEVTPEGTVFLPLPMKREMLKGLALGVLLGWVLARRLRR